MLKKTRSYPLLPPQPHCHSPSQSFPSPPRSLDSSVGALSHQLSTLGPLEDTYHLPKSSYSSCSLTPPHPLHSSSSSLPPTSSSSSFAGPCETDESRGFSQYDLRSQFRSNGTSCRSLSPSTRDHSPAGPSESQVSQPSVPTEDQYNFAPQPSSTSDRTGNRVLTGAPSSLQQGVAPKPDSKGQITAGLYGDPECLSPAGSLQSSSPGPSGNITTL